MASTRADVLLHPLRLRIMQAFIGGEHRTTAELAQVLDDVPQASLYRHIAVLANAGVLQVVEERRVKGAMERVYALRQQGVVLTADELAGASPDDHLRYFVTFAGTLIGDFSRYLSRPQIDLEADGVGYRTVGLHLDDEEFAEFVRRLRELEREMAARRPRSGRRRRLFATVLLPDDETPPSQTHEGTP